MDADLVFINGSVLTMDPGSFLEEAVAISKDRILDVGSTKKIKASIGPKTRVLDAEKNTILPGFIDCHVHLMQTGMDMMKIDLSQCTHLADVESLIAKRSNSLEKGEWVLGAGYNEFDWPEGRMLSLQELDHISPDNPVCLIRTDRHSSILNSLAFKELQIPLDLDRVEEETNGKKTGFVAGKANAYVRQSINRLLPKKTKKKILTEAAQKLISVGITTVHALDGGDHFGDDDVDLLLAERASLPLDVQIYFQTKQIKKVEERGLRSIGGCILIDGSLGSKTAALSKPYADDITTSGILYHSNEELEEFISEAHRKGLQISVHAIGDAAIEQILTAYEKALSAYPRKDHRHRIEHCSLPAPHHIKRCADLGVIISLQPSWFGANTLTQVVGPRRLGEQVGRLYPLASLLSAGIDLCGGSDSPVSPPGPLMGIDGGVNHFRREERVSPLSAAALFTTGAARAGFEEEAKGMVKPGYQADLVLLDGDLLSLSSADISSLAVKMTVARGEILFQA